MAKPGADDVLKRLRRGNARFCTGTARHPHSGGARLALAGRADQADHAYASVIACSDSRVPVELIFDAGVMDLFVVRVAGNVCGPSELASIEYGMAHLMTPVLVVLGHSRCGAVTAVTRARQEGTPLGGNLPHVADRIAPAVEKALAEGADLETDALVARAIEENVWQCCRDLFAGSPVVRQLVAEGRARVVGAVYDVGTGRVAWLAPEPVGRILEDMSDCPGRGGGHPS